jgi:hypothetical protein
MWTPAHAILKAKLAKPFLKYDAVSPVFGLQHCRRMRQPKHLAQAWATNWE